MSLNKLKTKLKGIFYRTEEFAGYLLGSLIIAAGLWFITGGDWTNESSSPVVLPNLVQETLDEKIISSQIKKEIPPLRLYPSEYAELHKEEIEAAIEKKLQAKKEEEKRLKEEEKRERLEMKEQQEQSKWMTFHGTFYSSDCYGCIGLTYYQGWDVTETIYSPQGYRVIAVDPNVIPLGSLVKVRYDNVEFTARAMDIGGKIDNYDVDILVSSESKANQLGVKQVQMKIIE